MKGTATHRNESATSRDRSSGASRERAAGTSHTTAAPNSTRSHVVSPGSNASSPSAMSRNDEPQIAPMDRNSAQSSAVNAPACVPTLVDSTPRDRVCVIGASTAGGWRGVPGHSRVMAPGEGSG